MSESLFSLPIEQQINPYITLRKKEQLGILVINHPMVRAAISLQGAQLLAWQPKGEKPVIWLSQSTPFQTGVPIRGGIPICWPWFGPAAKPSHGFARNETWTLTTHGETDEAVMLTLTLKDNEQTLNLWPHPFSLIVRYKLGKTCEIELESHGNYSFNAALHTYFNISDIDQISVSGLGLPYFDKVLNVEAMEKQNTLHFHGQTDRIYSQPDAYSLISDPLFNRTIQIHHQDNSDVVAWNPGAQIAANLADMPNDGYKTMICVETACVNRQASAKPDLPARLSATIYCKQTD